MTIRMTIRMTITCPILRKIVPNMPVAPVLQALLAIKNIAIDFHDAGNAA